MGHMNYITVFHYSSEVIIFLRLPTGQSVTALHNTKPKSSTAFGKQYCYKTNVLTLLSTSVNLLMENQVDVLTIIKEAICSINKLQIITVVT